MASKTTHFSRLETGSMAIFSRLGLGSSSNFKAQALLGLENFRFVPLLDYIRPGPDPCSNFKGIFGLKVGLASIVLPRYFRLKFLMTSSRRKRSKVG